MTSDPTSPQEADSVQDALLQLWNEHRDTIRARVDAIERAVVDLMQDELTQDTREDARREAHKLAGSLGTFGYSDGTRLARELERFLEGETPIPANKSVQLSELVIALRRELDREPVLQVDSRSVAEASTGGVPLLIVSSDEQWLKDLEVQAAGKGFSVTIAPSVEERPFGIAAEVTILDLDSVDPSQLEGSVLAVDEAPTLILAGSDDRLGAPLEISHREGRLFARKSTGATGLLRLVEEESSKRQQGTVTVLTVDDDPAVLAAVDTLLGAKGIRSETLQDPIDFERVLETVQPDLVVLDLDLPHRSGIELCRRMRSDPAWSALPVLVLTASTDPKVVEEVFRSGADDYIAKPLVGPEFLTRTSNRLERVRLLRSFSERDPLTGLLNRGAASPAMNNLLSLAEKQRKSVAIAVIDIDSLFRINEWHGHAAGDHVLRRAARLLTTEFRESSVLSRWSGVTFAVAAFDCDAAEAQSRIRGISDELWDQTFAGQAGETFRASCSAGIVEFPGDGKSLEPLIRSSDRLLQIAKSQGTGVSLTTTSDPSGRLATDRVDILVIEDDEPISALLQHSFETRGYNVMCMADGKKALHALMGEPPEVAAKVIVLDVGLPGLDGLSLLRKLSKEGMLDRTRVVMLTSRSEESEVLKALELGAFDHVSKPFSLPILMHRIRRALDS
jgi:diguanylate cyclase (GGDEF)-like protein